MMSLRQYVEAQQERTLAARALLLPLLALEDDERPWTADRLEALWRRRAQLDPALLAAVEHLYAFEVPLLRREEALEERGLGYAEVEDELVRFEQGFWEWRYAERPPDASPANGAGRASSCARHVLPDGAIRALARDEGVFETDEAMARTGADATCAACRLATTRILVEELTRRKALA